MKPDRRVELRWSGRDLEFVSTLESGTEIAIDSSGSAGPSPMDALLLGLAGCMAVDVLMILQKSRVPVESLTVEAVGERADSVPRRYTRVELVYRIAGPRAEHEPRLERAVELSREKYCSVLHTLRPDLDLAIRIVRA